MVKTADFLALNARRYDDGSAVDVLVSGGVIEKIEAARGAPAERRAGEAKEVEDFGGHIVSPAFSEPHFHLDKCFASDVELPGGTLDEQLRAFAEAKKSFTPKDVADRAVKTARIMLSRGVCTLRTFADVDASADLRIFEGLMAAKRRLAGAVDLQVCVFPQSGIYTQPGTLDLVKHCLANGADAMGGHSELEKTPEDVARQVDLVFELAREHDVDADFHVDETDSHQSRWLEFCAGKAIEFGHQGRTNLAHACSISHQDEAYRKSVYARLIEAGANVASSPTSGLLFRGHAEANPPRGITMVKEMLAAGVNVVCAQETYKSVFSRHLRFPDPLFTGQLMSYVAKLSDEDGLRTVYRMLTHNAARALRVADYGLAPGCRADLVFLAADSMFDALTRLSPARVVLKAGRIVARSSYADQVWNPDTDGLAAVPHA